MSNSKFQKIIFFAFIAILVIYFLFQVILSNFSGYSVEDAVYVTVKDSISTTGWVFRNEAYVYNDIAGTISYVIPNGNVVSKGETIANIFDDESRAVIYKQAQNLKKDIEALTQINNTVEAAASNLDTVNNSIESKIISLLSELNKHSYLEIDKIKSSLILSINQRQYLIGADDGYGEYIEQLKTQLSRLESEISSKGTVNADMSGYFVSKYDGYENSLDYKDILNTTLDDIDNLKAVQPAGNCVGKLVTDFKWYIAAKVTSDDILKLAQTSSFLTADMPFVVNHEIPVIVEKVNRKDSSSDGVVILSCELLNEELIQARSEPIQINLRTHTGLRVPKKAIHDKVVEVTNEHGETEKKTVQGVYVLSGREIVFREIFIIYSSNDYVLCDSDQNNENLITGTTIKLYDQIITQGDDIYDGKIVE